MIKINLILASCVFAAAGVLSTGGAAYAGGAYGMTGLSGGYRWDAAPRTFAQGERSLSGGIRYSVQGGSYQAFRDLFTWNAVPSLAVFEQTVTEAFDAWRAVDPISGLGTSLSFVPDFSTSVAGFNGGGVNVNGAEIDLLAATSAGSWSVGSTGTQGETYFNAAGGTVTLTSGVSGYAAGAIVGADVKLNNNSGAVYNVDLFRLLLTHEIGHALGFADVDAQAGPQGFFLDDNYNAASPVATLNNSWAGLVNTTNPAASPLSRYTIPSSVFATPGVNIVMESFGLGGQFGNLSPMSNDDYGMRQFLYPSLAPVTVPENGTGLLALFGAGVGALRIRRRRQPRQDR